MARRVSLSDGASSAALPNVREQLAEKYAAHGVRIVGHYGPDLRAQRRAEDLRAGEPVAFARREVRTFLPESMQDAAWVILQPDGRFVRAEIVRDETGTVDWRPA